MEKRKGMENMFSRGKHVKKREVDGLVIRG